MKGKRFLIGVLFGFIAIVIATLSNLLSLADGIQILILYGLVLVTAQYAKTSEKMAKEMEAESVLRRPYLNFDNWYLPDPANQKLWRVNLKNFGATPAYGVEIEVKPRLRGYQGTLPVLFTGASALIMPGQWNQWTIDLSSVPEIASNQHMQLEVEFIIRYRSAGRKPFKTWELRLVRTPNPAISNWSLVGEDRETEIVSGA